MTDPYRILGVSRDATDDEVKKAYRELAKKYHPDNYHDSPLGDLATEKMKEINAAYDEIQKQRSSGSPFSDYDSSEGSAYSSSGYSGSGSDVFSRIRQLISEGRLMEAELACETVPLDRRGAEWFYLRGQIYKQRGQYGNAASSFGRAYAAEPSNPEYSAAYESMKDAQRRFGNMSNRNTMSNCSACDICSGLLCADCLCECCGGDLISCC